ERVTSLDAVPRPIGEAQIPPLRHHDGITRLQHNVAWFTTAGHEIIVLQGDMDLSTYVVTIFSYSHNLQPVFLRVICKASSCRDSLEYRDIRLELVLSRLRDFSQDKHRITVDGFYAHRHRRSGCKILFETLGDPLREGVSLEP